MTLLISALNNLRGKVSDRHLSSLPFRALLSGALLLVSLILVNQRPSRRRSKYISNLEKVGKKVTDDKALNLKDDPEYDIVIIGGGTSGCVVAARLSENPNIRVLLLESGGSGQAHPDVRMPCAFSGLFRNERLVHNFFTEPQSSANGDRKFWPRARMLGGCSSINAQVALYGSSGDFDEWSNIIGDESWAWKNMARYFRKFESFQPHPDYPSVDANVRGRTGPVQIGFFNTVSVWCNSFIRACLAVGMPINPDFGGAQLKLMGVGRLMTFVNKQHERVSSESAYLTPAVLNRFNLTVAINATVLRVLLTATDGNPRAVGVEFASQDNGPRYQAAVRKEVILCAGAIQSPTILMLSGIGPAPHLEEKGIPVVCDLPGVGANLLDHPAINMHFKQNGIIEPLNFLRPRNIPDVFKFIWSLFQYYVFQTGGPMAMNFCEAAAFFRTDDPVLFPPEEYPETLEDSTPDVTSPDLECLVVSLAAKDHGKVIYDVETFAIVVTLLRPTSQGYILLKSVNPFDHPVIDPNYLQTRGDVAKLMRGVHLGLKIGLHEPINSLMDRTTAREEFYHNLHLKSDSELEEVVRKQVQTIYHPTSTCRMAKREDGGVVDARLRVYGVEGLRVCDASIFPNIVSGHPMGACLAIGEKLAALIVSEVARA